MLAELTLLLHETSDSLRSRTTHPDVESLTPPDPTPSRPVPAGVVLVSGLPSHGKACLVEALQHRLKHAPLRVVFGSRAESLDDPAVLHVHAETDLDAMLEGGPQPLIRDLARHADLVVRVDWEPVEPSVGRVIEALVLRGLLADEAT